MWDRRFQENDYVNVSVWEREEKKKSLWNQHEWISCINFKFKNFIGTDPCRYLYYKEMKGDYEG